MNNQQQKTYFGNGKEHVFQDGGSVIRVSFSAEDLKNMQNCLNDRGYINLNINRRQQISQYGHTHSISLDTWQPQQQPQQPPQQQSQGQYQQPQYQAPQSAPAQAPPAMPARPQMPNVEEDGVPF